MAIRNWLFFCNVVLPHNLRLLLGWNITEDIPDSRERT